jgi:type F conjugative transfer system protein TrbI
MRRLLRFFFVGPGAILTVIFIGLGVCWIIKSGQDRQAEEARKHQVQRELGNIKPSEEVDKSQASKEVMLANRRLNPVPGSQPTPTPPPVIGQQPVVRAQALPTLVSFYAQVTATPIPTPTPAPERPKTPEIFLPRGVFIPCALVNTVESSHINTPVVGEVIRDVYQNGHLIIPAGAIVTCWAQPGAVRDRIEVAGKWSLTYPDGKEFELQGVACDREADPANQQFGTEDGSAGLQGELVESDHYGNAKAFIALLLTAATQTGTAVATSALQAAHTTGVTGLPDTTPILAKYLDQLLEGKGGDARFVRVRASKEFYIFSASVVEPTKRSVGARRQQEERSDQESINQSKALPSDNDEALGEALRMERKIQEAAQTQDKNEDQVPRFKY